MEGTIEYICFAHDFIHKYKKIGGGQAPCNLCGKMNDPPVETVNIIRYFIPSESVD